MIRFAKQAYEIEAVRLLQFDRLKTMVTIVLATAAGVFALTLYVFLCYAGYVFFKWCDQPVCGRKSEKFENSNYGLETADDEP